LVDSHAELQMIKRKIQDNFVLNLLVRACPPPDTDFERQHFEKPDLSTVVYQEPIIYDLSEPPILVVDQEGVVFESQCSISSTHHPAGPPGVCTQESKNATTKLKAVLEEEEEGYQGFDAYEDSDANAPDEDG